MGRTCPCRRARLNATDSRANSLTRMCWSSLTIYLPTRTLPLQAVTTASASGARTSTAPANGPISNPALPGLLQTSSKTSCSMTKKPPSPAHGRKSGSSMLRPATPPPQPTKARPARTQTVSARITGCARRAQVRLTRNSRRTLSRPATTIFTSGTSIGRMPQPACLL